MVNTCENFSFRVTAPETKMVNFKLCKSYGSTTAFFPAYCSKDSGVTKAENPFQSPQIRQALCVMMLAVVTQTPSSLIVSTATTGQASAQPPKGNVTPGILGLFCFPCAVC